MTDSNRTNLAGEFYAMHRLLLQGYEATLTLGNTKSVDILLLNPKTDKLFKVEVKTSCTIMSEKIFGGKNMRWFMQKKHEQILDKNLIYAFVYLPENRKESPRIFFVPAKDVAEYCKWENEEYLKAERKKPVKDTEMRAFRISTEKPCQWEDNISLFE